MKEETGEVNIETVTFNELLDYLRANNLKLAPSTYKTLKTLGYIARTSEYNISKVIPFEKVSKYWMTGTGIPAVFLPCFAYDARITDFCLKYITTYTLPIYIQFIDANIGVMSTEKILRVLKYARELDTDFKLYSTEDTSRKDLVLSTYLECCSDPGIPIFNNGVNVLKLILDQPTLEDMETVYEALAHPIIRKNPECIENAKSKKNITKNRRYLKNKTEIVESAINANDDELNPLINSICLGKYASVIVLNGDVSENAGELLKKAFDVISFFEDYELLRELLYESNILNSAAVLKIIGKCRNADEYECLRDICYSLIYYLKNKDYLEKRPYLKSIRHSIISHLAASKDEDITYLLNELMMIVDTETKEISKPRALKKDK